MPKTLKLTLSKLPFDVMVTGEKTCEYRKPSDWIKSRLLTKDGIHREYDFVKFTNGYGADKPYFVARFVGAFEWKVSPTKTKAYANGLVVDIEKGDFVIKLGEIVERGNL